MEIKYTPNKLSTVDIETGNDKLKMAFTNETKQLFVQITTSYSKSGEIVSQTSCAFNKEEFKKYIDVLEEMYKQM